MAPEKVHRRQTSKGALIKRDIQIYCKTYETRRHLIIELSR